MTEEKKKPTATPYAVRNFEREGKEAAFIKDLEDCKKRSVREQRLKAGLSVAATRE